MPECKQKLLVEFLLPWFQCSATEFRVVPVVVSMNPSRAVLLLLMMTPLNEPGVNMGMQKPDTLWVELKKCLTKGLCQIPRRKLLHNLLWRSQFDA